MTGRTIRTTAYLKGRSNVTGDDVFSHASAVHWDVIERVAAALIERGELSGDEVDALVGAFGDE